MHQVPQARRALPVVTLLFLCATNRTPGEELDPSKLPPAATGQIEFVRDIKPLFESHCYKCHGGEKPKSGFSLLTREGALKGGRDGVDIVPGNSAKSPLVYYTARVVEDMEMPPDGKGVPLTKEEVGKLRAWIDQGATWEKGAAPTHTAVEATPTVGWTGVSGDKGKFRELFWQPEGWNGGLEDFALKQQLGTDSRFTASGHLFRDDYALTLAAEKNDLGFTRFGWTQFRKYYDDTGGYYPGFSPSAFSLSRDLYFDHGRAWTEVGLTLPDWPRMVLGYEYQYKDGTEATLQWGPVSNGSTGGARNIYPAFKEVDERVHVLKFDLDYERSNFLLSDNVRAEWYDLQSRRENDSFYTLGAAAMATTIANEQQSHFQGANTFHLEDRFTDWLFASGGYLYSKFNGDGSLDVTTLNAAYLDPAGAGAPGWQTQGIQLERESHVFSVSCLLGPWEGLTLSLGTQNEWTRQTGLSDATVNFVTPLDPAPSDLGLEYNQGQSDREIFGQEAELRFTKIPYTTLFLEARLQEDRIGQSQEEAGGLTPFLVETDATSDLTQLRAGFNTSPWRRVSLSGHYRWYDKQTDYNNFPKGYAGSPTAGYDGYPGFIRRRTIDSDEAQMKLSLQTTPWLKTTLTYQWLANRYHTATDPVQRDPTTNLPGDITPGLSLLAGSYDSHVASLGATVTRWSRLFLYATVAYQHSTATTADNGLASVVPYEGDIYSVIGTATYKLGEKTDFIATYSFSTADYAQSHFAAGLPLGMKYQLGALQAGIKHKVSTHGTLGLQYRFYHYDEPSSGGSHDFDAHGVFATFSLN